MFINKILLGVAVVSIAVFSCYGFDPKRGENIRDQPAGKGFAVVELFTSEGCSSCPSADELVRKVLAENKQDVYIVSFHVDYWNRLGWTDAFSKAAYSNRQQQYARHLALDGVYTPQIVVNGSDQFVGSDERKLRTSISNSKEVSHLEVDATRTGNALHISYNIPANNNELLNIALVQPEAVTMVKSGENGGRELHHVNIVREFSTIETTADKGTAEIQISKELLQSPIKLIAYTQQKNSFKITGVVQATVSEKLSQK